MFAQGIKILQAAKHGKIGMCVCVCLSKLQKMVEDRGPWHAAVHGVTKSWI